MDWKRLPLGTHVYCVARDGGQWYDSECVVGNEAWIGNGANVLRCLPEPSDSCLAPRSRRGNMVFTGLAGDVYTTRAEAQAEADRLQASDEAARDARRVAEIKQRARLEALRRHQAHLRDTKTCPDCLARQAADDAEHADGFDEVELKRLRSVVSALRPLRILNHEEFECPVCANSICIPDIE